MISSLTYPGTSSDITPFLGPDVLARATAGGSATTASSRPQRGGSIGGDHDAMIAIRSLRQTVVDLVVVARIFDEHVNHRLKPRR